MLRCGKSYKVLTLQSREITRTIGDIYILTCGDTGRRPNIWSASTVTIIISCATSIDRPHLPTESVGGTSVDNEVIVRGRVADADARRVLDIR